MSHGVPLELSSDGGPEFVANETQDFLRRWGVHHRLSSAYHPQSNGRAEIAVKSMKRLLQENVSLTGEISTEGYTRAMLQFRNTPDPINGKSPAQIVFGRPLHDILPVKPRTQVFDNESVRTDWTELWKNREVALRTRAEKQLESLSTHTRSLNPLRPGDSCRIQNQAGRFPNRWDKTGRIVEVAPYDQYIVRVNGTRRLTLRNRAYLRQIEETTDENFLPQMNKLPEHHDPTVPQNSNAPLPAVHNTPGPTSLMDRSNYNVPA